MRIRKAALVAGSIFCASLAQAAMPDFYTDTCPVRLDGTRVGTDLTPGNSSLRNTIAYEPSTGLYHFWGFVADDPSFPSAASALGAAKHATSNDGIHFTSDAYLAYGVGSADYTDYGATIDPPLDFFRAVFDTDTGTWKLFNWTENVGSSVGLYNYNSSVNDLGSVASNTSVLHQGPLNSPFAGNHVGMFGLVEGNLYLRVDSSTGGDGQFAYTDGIPPATGGELGEADLFAGTPYCWGLDPACGNTDPRIPAYVHNVGRTLRQADGTLGTYYAFRHWDGSRMDKQIWYVESGDNGVTWSAPAGVFADGNAVTIAQQPLDADAGSANFSSIEIVRKGGLYRAYFSTQDAAGNYVFVTSLSHAADTVFADGFEACAN